MNFVNFKYNVIFTFFIILFWNCKSAPDYKGFKKEIDGWIIETEKYQKEGKLEEAYQRIQMIEEYEPDNKIVQSIKSQIESQKINKDALIESKWLGFNKARRAKERNVPLWKKVVWYIPDRIFDAMDIISVSVNTGPQYGAGVWVTRAAQVNAFAGASVGAGYYQKRNIAGKAEASAEIGLGPFSPAAVGGARAGTNGVDYIYAIDYFHKPSDELYTYYRDYWGVGAKVGAFIIGVEFEVHPVEFFDFLAGFFLFDVGNDDLATTRFLRNYPMQDLKMRKLVKKLKNYNPKEYQKVNGKGNEK